MASQASQAERSCSASYRNSSQGRRRRTTCYYRERPVLVTSSTAENPERRFWGCVNYGIGEECGYFVWAESEKEQEVARLKRKITCLKGKVTTLERMLTMAVAVAEHRCLCRLVGNMLSVFWSVAVGIGLDQM
ncbi:uncharacterized protein LOC127748519 [Arachis duranensis]|uniref:Uncharacterized protein LOC127748519 n=1 Tax=Arachis duranensis TaxID=130453 RepID=A0A9C6TRW2_ARADU|nr:uncharacterized protein LOC127748519 [Arachis duranensis]